MQYYYYYACCKKPIQCCRVASEHSYSVDWLPDANNRWIYEPTRSLPVVPVVYASGTRKVRPSTVAVPLSLRDKIMQVCSATALSFANGAWKEAVISGRTWGAISAVYACLQSASKVVRGRDDKYNNVLYKAVFLLHFFPI
ncbi:hypothetical protein Gasu2_07300 [Galdieria sulphuraria]|nr:hypothetical protein Gasu2_07300 [Galdieria sulphuraria]